MAEPLFFVKAKFKAKDEAWPIVSVDFEHGIYVYYYSEHSVGQIIASAMAGEEEFLAYAFIADEKYLRKILRVAQGDPDVEYITVRRIK